MRHWLKGCPDPVFYTTQCTFLVWGVIGFITPLFSHGWEFPEKHPILVTVYIIVLLILCMTMILSAKGKDLYQNEEKKRNKPPASS